jgi:hypothetical protein
MRLWLISQSRNNDYDTFDSAVVAAETEAEARLIHPRGDTFWKSDGPEGAGWYTNSFYGEPYRASNSWCHPSDVDVQYLGSAAEPTTPQVFCSSFNAG